MSNIAGYEYGITNGLSALELHELNFGGPGDRHDKPILTRTAPCNFCKAVKSLSVRHHSVYYLFLIFWDHWTHSELV